jgi:hypothetical protein
MWVQTRTSVISNTAATVTRRCDLDGFQDSGFVSISSAMFVVPLGFTWKPWLECFALN